MIAITKHLFYIKLQLLLSVVVFTIAPISALKAFGTGGKNDSISTSLKPELSYKKQIDLIAGMSEEQLTSLIDKMFEMDTIPLDLINEVNIAVFNMKGNENTVKTTAFFPTSSPIDISKLEEAKRMKIIASILGTNNIKIMQTFPKNKVSIHSENAVANVPKADLKEIEKIVPEITAMEILKMNDVAVHSDPNIEEIKVVDLREIEKTKPQLTPLQMIKMNYSAIHSDPNTAEIYVANLKEIEKIKPLFTPMETIKMNSISSLPEEDKAEIHNANLKETETFRPEYIAMQTFPVTMELTLSETHSNYIPPIELRDLEEIVLPSYKFQQSPLVADLHKMELKNEMNTIVESKNETIETTLIENLIPSSPDEIKEEQPLTNNISAERINTTNLSIPSTDHYVTWEIDKLFPESDMLKMKSDTSVNLILLSKEHRHYFHPFNGPITSGFGWRDSAQHNGIDIDLNRGDKVSAAFDGMVRVAKRYGGFGNVVIIRHYNGLETVYAHLSKIKVKPGQLVSSGDLVGLGGSTGHSTGTHLHFEVRFKGVPINPKYLISLTEQKLMCDEFTLRKTKWGLGAFPKNTKLYIVEKGDTVFEIAKRFGTSTASIKEMNHLNSSKVRLKAGQQINVAH